jgi:hypothetical protein
MEDNSKSEVTFVFLYTAKAKNTTRSKNIPRENGRELNTGLDPVRNLVLRIYGST